MSNNVCNDTELGGVAHESADKSAGGRGRPSRASLSVDEVKKVAKCYGSMSSGSSPGIGHIVARCGELLGASQVFYHSIDGEALTRRAEWKGPRHRESASLDELFFRSMLQSDVDQVTVVSTSGNESNGETDSASAPEHKTIYAGRIVRVQETKVGLLTVCFEDDGAISDIDEGLMDLMASALVQDEFRVAMERRSRESRKDIEQRMVLRAAQLRKVSQDLAQEIDLRKRLEKELRESWSTYRSLKENSPLGLISCDGEGRIVENNAQALRILGAPSEDVMKSKNVFESSPFSDSTYSGMARDCIESGKLFVKESSCRSAWGKEICVRLHVSPIRNSEGEISGVQTLVEDIADFKRTQELLLKTERLKAVSNLTGGVANSFNNLLQFVARGARLALDALEKGNLTEIKPLLQDVVDNTRQSAQTLRRLHQFAKVQSDTGAFRLKVFDLCDAVRQGIEMSKAAVRNGLPANEKHVTLKTDLAAGCFVEGESRELSEVVANLVKNAEEAMPEGGVITVRTSREEGRVVLRVRDEGTGIPKQHLEQMFEPFWTSKESHAGLGLAVNLGIVRRHGGRMFVKTKKGHGSTFVVSLPQAKMVTPREEPSAPRKLVGLNFGILMVDDDEAYLKNMEQGLELLGQQIFIASSGKAALEILEENEIDAVVCDLVMEGMSGWDVSKAVQAVCVEKGIPKPPFILLTAYARQLSENEIFSYPGVNRIIEKPVSLPKLLEVIREEIQEGTFIGHKLDLKLH